MVGYGSAIGGKTDREEEQVERKNKRTTWERWCHSQDLLPFYSIGHHTSIFQFMASLLPWIGCWYSKNRQLMVTRQLFLLESFKELISWSLLPQLFEFLRASRFWDRKCFIHSINSVLDRWAWERQLTPPCCLEKKQTPLLQIHIEDAKWLITSFY